VTVYDELPALNFVNEGYEGSGNLIAHREEEESERVLLDEASYLVEITLSEIIWNVHPVPWFPIINVFAELKEGVKMKMFGQLSPNE